MNVLHIAPHLGGGVGKAHAAMAEAAIATAIQDGAQVHHAFALLEPPRDLDYVRRIEAAGCDIHIAPDVDHLAAMAACADVVQIEWWNHPRLYELLVSNRLPEIRVAAWLHISGLVPPLVPRSLVDLVDHTLFTSPCSFGAPNLRGSILDRPHAFELVNSGFGLEDVAHRPRTPGAPLRFGYLGTLDFVKLHPAFFDYIDAVASDIRVHLWGRHDPAGEVAQRAAAMLHPERVRFEGFTTDPASVLSALDVFVYLLAPDHYGTAENALVEAMSAGAVPIVFANVAETYIVQPLQTGYVVASQAEFVSLVGALMADPWQLEPIRAAARASAARHHSPATSISTLNAVYASLMSLPKRKRDFATALGCDARAWLLSSISVSGEDERAGARLLSHVASKGSLGHFRACFPQDKSLESFGRRIG